MEEQDAQKPPTLDLNVAADEISIYQGGNLTGVGVEDLIDNEVAIIQIINDLNLKKKHNDQLRGEIEQLKQERIGYALQPGILGIVAIFNILGMALIGIGTNLLTGTTNAPYAGWVLSVGIIVAIISALTPIFLAWLIKNIIGKQNAE